MIRVAGRFFDLRRTYDSEESSGEQASSGAPESSGIVVPPGAAICISAASAFIFLWLGLSQSLMSAGDFATSFSLYPWDSVCEEQLMYYSKSEEEMGEHIDHILRVDPFSSAAWRMQAFRSSSYGDYDTMTESVARYLSIRKYDMEAYSDMIVLLDKTAKRIKKDDPGSAKVLADNIVAILDMIEKTKNATSPLAYKLRDLPEFALSEEAEEIVEMYK